MLILRCTHNCHAKHEQYRAMLHGMKSECQLVIQLLYDAVLTATVIYS